MHNFPISILSAKVLMSYTRKTLGKVMEQVRWDTRSVPPKFSEASGCGKETGTGRS